MPELWSAVEFVHHLLREHLQAGDCAFDATMGRGTDTAFLLDCVGKTGRVLATDIQSEALEATRQRLADHPNRNRVELVQQSHASIKDIAITYAFTAFDAVVFNCGYLPGSDKVVRTSADETLAALQGLETLLSERAIVCLVCYVGHEGGEEERLAVERYLESLATQKYSVRRFEAIGRRNAPVCYSYARNAAVSRGISGD